MITLLQRDDALDAPKGTWTPVEYWGKSAPIVRCPCCGRTMLLDHTLGFAVDATGVVAKRFECPYLRCTYAGDLQLEGWPAP